MQLFTGRFLPAQVKQSTDNEDFAEKSHGGLGSDADCQNDVFDARVNLLGEDRHQTADHADFADNQSGRYLGIAEKISFIAAAYAHACRAKS